MSKLIIFDTETTGLEENDRIIQVGAIIVDLKDKNAIEPPYNELCQCNIPIKIEAMATHGIREEEILEKPLYKDTKFKQRLDELNSEENFLIAHNLDFDLNMLNKEGFQNQCKLIDTLQCAMHLYKAGDEVEGYILPNHKLQTFRYILLKKEREEKEAEKYNVQIQAHDAIGDVVILKLFLEKLYIEVVKQYKIDPAKKQTVFNKMVELTKLPAEVKIINFGQYRGQRLLDIESNVEPNKWGKPTGPSYIDWLFKEQEIARQNLDGKFNKNFHYTLKLIIEQRTQNRKQAQITDDGINF